MDIHTSFFTQKIAELSNPLEPIPTGLSASCLPVDDIQAVLFDVYGTLFISGVGEIGIHEPIDSHNAFHAALRVAGFQLNDSALDRIHPDLLRVQIQQTHEELKGQGIDYPEVDYVEEWQKMIQSLLEQELISGEINQEKLQLAAVEYEFRVNPLWPMPKLHEILASIKHSNRVLGIISNAQFFTPLLFDAFFQRSAYEMGFSESISIWSYQWKYGKPSLKLYQIASERLQQQFNIEPHQVLYIGNDIRNDIWPASQMGFKTVLFAGDKRSLRLRENDENCNNVKPECVITDLAQLLDILGE
jgi:putative hydrolase of the HAD superfamily